MRRVSIEDIVPDVTHVATPIATLTDDQITTFVYHLLDGKKDVDAARLAGFAQPNAAAIRLIGDPRVLAEIDTAIANKLRSDLAPKALATLDDMLSEKSARTVRLAAAKVVLDRAGFVPPKPPESPRNPERDISQKSGAELREFIAQAERALASRAKDVGGSSTAPPSSEIDVKRSMLRQKAERVIEADAGGEGEEFLS